MNENVRLVATAVVIIIFLSLSWVYRTSIKKNLQENSGNSPVLGLLVIVLSFLLAWWWMSGGPVNALEDGKLLGRHYKGSLACRPQRYHWQQVDDRLWHGLTDTRRGVCFVQVARSD